MPFRASAYAVPRYGVPVLIFVSLRFTKISYGTRTSPRDGAAARPTTLYKNIPPCPVYHIKKELITIKKTKSSRSKVNFQNPKVKAVIRTLELSENRITRQAFMEIGTKDIFYQMKAAGYLTESSKGIYKASPKLISKMEKDYKESFGRSSSPAHSEKINQSLKLLPSSVIAERNFQTGKELEEAFSKFQKTDTYKEALQNRFEEIRQAKENLETYHNQMSQSNESPEAKIEEDLFFRRQNDNLNRSLAILDNQPCHSPDYSFSCTYEESQFYLEQLETYRESFSPFSKEESIYTKAISKMSSLLSTYHPGDTITWNIEIITNSYGAVDMEQHANYELLTGQPVLYLT